MKKYIIDFYKNKGIPIPLLIDKSQGLSPPAVEAGAVEVFNEIQDGLKIEDKDIPRYVWKKSININARKYKQDRLKIYNYDKKVKSLALAYKKNYKELKRLESLPSSKELKRLRIYSIMLSSTAVLYAILKITGAIL